MLSGIKTRQSILEFSGTWFTDKELKNPRALVGVDREPWVRLGTWLNANGIYRPPAIPSWFLSTAHTDDDIETLIEKTEDFFKRSEVSLFLKFFGPAQRNFSRSRNKPRAVGT